MAIRTFNITAGTVLCKSTEEVIPVEETEACSSAKKIKFTTDSNFNYEDDHYILFSFQVLTNILGNIGKCPACGNGVVIKNDIVKKRGFANKLVFSCNTCEWTDHYFTSLKTDKTICKDGGTKVYDVNIRSTFAFREVGKGYSTIEKFAANMNMLQPVSKLRYHKINQNLHAAYVDTASKSMRAAAAEVKAIVLSDETAQDIADCQVSVDGTWQKRGFASLNGIITVISKENGKCIDIEVKSKHCNSCSIWHNKKGSQEYVEWEAKHQPHCKANHKQSSGAMESAGAVAIFKRSIEKNKLRYVSYIGDGDTSSYAEVRDAKPYGEVPVVKKECIGHVQKRMGTRLRNLRKSMKGEILSDGKRVSGTGRLSDKNINLLQNYYGMAIRQNTDNIYKMKMAIGATLYHCTNMKEEGMTDLEAEEKQHQFCPKSEDSWCKWQADKITGLKTYKSKVSLPKCIKDILYSNDQGKKTIFRDLSDNTLLTKCLHNFTQNQNESLNNVIWTKCPKNVFVGRDVLELSTSSAVINYNDGNQGLPKVLDNLGLKIGQITIHGWIKLDKSRIRAMSEKHSKTGKLRRKKLRSSAKGWIDLEKEKEGGESYSSGHF